MAERGREERRGPTRAIGVETNRCRMGAKEETAKTDVLGIRGATTDVVETKRGAGRITVRKKQLERGETEVKWNGRRIAQVAHENLVQGEKPGDPTPRYPKEMARKWVEKENVDDPVELSRSMVRCRKGEPVAWKNSTLVQGLLGKWTLEYLAVAMGKTNKGHEVLVSDAEKHRFLLYDGRKNLYGSIYHVREPETIHMNMSCEEYAECAKKWTEKRPRLSLKLLKTGFMPGSQKPHMMDDLGRTVKEDFCDCVDWEWCKNLLLVQGFGTVNDCELQCTTKNALMPARYEEWDSFFVQLTGRRRVLLVDPSQAFEGMYPYPVAHPYDQGSMVDFDHPDYGQWPKLSRTHGMVCIMEPGDVLYVPRFWFRHVQTLDEEEVSLEMKVGPGNRTLQEACFPLAVSRLLETRLVAAEGLESARLWLERIANGEDMEYIDWKTVPGYKRIQLVQMVKDEVADVIGKDAVSSFLLDMIDGRMLPTPWLNQNFREPLYLQDRPYYVDDTRTEWERKYPELFRKRLLQEGYEVQPTVSTVPIPGYNMPTDADWRTWGLE